MNDDLISRAALQKVFEAECVGECGCCKHIKHNPEGCDLIDDAPAVDAEPVRHGRWEQYPGPGYTRCTYCKLEFDERKMPIARDYCPNCGAKMDLKEGEDGETVVQ